MREIIARGIPSNKIIVGKPATPGDATNTGYVSPATLGTWISKAYDDLKWYGGVMFWQFKNDPDGLLMGKATSQLIAKVKRDGIVDGGSSSQQRRVVNEEIIQ